MYKIRWKRAAYNQLAQLWIDAADRRAVTDAIDEIDHELTIDSHKAGESRSGAIRVMFVPPLGVFFEIDEVRQVVEVLKVWAF